MIRNNRLFCKGACFANPGEQSFARELSESKMLEITELRSGLMIRSFSHVGRVNVGGIGVTVLPKISQSALLNLLRYAYGFRKLKLLDESEQSLDNYGFADILVSQLNVEARELLGRGLHRTYISQREWLSMPRGRIDIQKLAAKEVCGWRRAGCPLAHVGGLRRHQDRPGAQRLDLVHALLDVVLHLRQARNSGAGIVAAIVEQDHGRLEIGKPAVELVQPGRKGAAAGRERLNSSFSSG